MRGSRLFKGLIVAGMSIVLVSCTVEPEISEELKAVRALAKACALDLEAGNYEGATIHGEKVVNTAKYAAVDDVAVDQARFCYTTANTLIAVNDLTNELKTILQTITMLMTEGQLSSPEGIRTLGVALGDTRFESQGASPISIVLSAFLGKVRATLKENEEHLGFIIENNRFAWKINHIPVKVGDAEIMDAGGVYDMGEIHMLYGLTRSILATLYLIEAQDYTFNMNALVDYLTTPGNPVLDLTSEPGIALTNMYAVLMGSSPLFLSLDKTAGRELMADAGEGYARGFDAFLDAVKFMKARKGDQSDRVIEFLHKEDQDYLVIHVEFKNSANPIPVFDLAKFNGAAIPIAEDILDSVANIRDDIAGVSGVNTNLQRDVFPLVAMGTVVLVGSGAFDALINTALQSVEPGQVETINKILAVIKENEDIVLGALVALVPVQIELDLGHLFKQPENLRDSLPAWTQPPSTDDMAAYMTATVVYSYECDGGGDPLRAGTFLCRSASPASDQDHFRTLDGSPYYVLNGTMPVDSGLDWTDYSGSGNFGPKWNSYAPIAGDGIPTIIPYLGFKDPTLGNVLFLDIAAIENSKLTADGPGYQPATLRTLNATLASSFATVQGFISAP